MSEGILIFTFSPVQQFIAEARRSADLFTGSQILTELARSAGEAIGTNSLIYPRNLQADVPNKLVARVPWEQAKQIAERAREALLDKWQKIAEKAREELETKSPKPDSVWCDIWKRQINNMWEVYWAAASMEGRSYKDAYEEASRVLDGVKRTRSFEAVEEDGLKDTLSGRRSALRTASHDARSYWRLLSENERSAKLRPEGRERLDAIGAVKRFCSIANKPFPSTSTIASYEFLELARADLSKYRSTVEQPRATLSEYRWTVEKLLKGNLYKVRPTDCEWPYDGDLLYIDTLTANRLEATYGVANPDEVKLLAAREQLSQIYRKLNCCPSPYYAVVIMDGDEMGARISKLLEDPSEPMKAHSEFSDRLAEFADSVPKTIGNEGWLVYNGGDDVLLFCPLSKAVPLAQKLSGSFRDITGATASAGIAIAHHLHPLDAVLSAARRAESEAKHLRGRNSICIHVMRRGGEEIHLGSKWDDLKERFDKLISHFISDDISSRLAYDILYEAPAITGVPDEKLRLAYLKRLVSRHKSSNLPSHQEESLVSEMCSWSFALDKTTPTENNQPQGLVELGRWLVFARFVAKGGAE